MLSKHHTRASSIECFHNHQAQFGAQEQAIIDYLKTHPGDTRREISKGTGIETGSVSGRVHKLIHELKVLHELPRRECRVTGISSHGLMIKPVEPVQEALFA